MTQVGRRRATQVAGTVATVALAAVVWWISADGSDNSTTVPTRTGLTTVTTAPDGVDAVSGLPWIEQTELPPEAVDTLDQIEAGPPYPYDRDGVTFENREGILPDEEPGYYQEFTVETPGSSDRGARRIIWGLEDEFYYTDDHYASFSRVSP